MIKFRKVLETIRTISYTSSSYIQLGWRRISNVGQQLYRTIIIVRPSLLIPLTIRKKSFSNFLCFYDVAKEMDIVYFSSCATEYNVFSISYNPISSSSEKPQKPYTIYDTPLILLFLRTQLCSVGKKRLKNGKLLKGKLIKGLLNSLLQGIKIDCFVVFKILRTHIHLSILTRGSLYSFSASEYFIILSYISRHKFWEKFAKNFLQSHLLQLTTTILTMVRRRRTTA